MKPTLKHKKEAEKIVDKHKYAKCWHESHAIDDIAQALAQADKRGYNRGKRDNDNNKGQHRR